MQLILPLYKLEIQIARTVQALKWRRMETESLVGKQLEKRHQEAIVPSEPNRDLPIGMVVFGLAG